MVLLQPSLITTCTRGGQLQETPLPEQQVQAVWPCTAGLLLEVRPHSRENHGWAPWSYSRLGFCK